jgi:hypothetical protein
MIPMEEEWSNTPGFSSISQCRKLVNDGVLTGFLDMQPLYFVNNTD